jgi:hypothetical protein
MIAQENFNHDKNTKINTVMLLQRKVLQKQVDLVQKLSEEKRTYSISDAQLSSSLIFRYEAFKKVVDESELTLLGILDHDGLISSKNRLHDFMFLMTRLSKVKYFYSFARNLIYAINFICSSNTELCAYTFLWNDLTPRISEISLNLVDTDC